MVNNGFVGNQRGQHSHQKQFRSKNCLANPPLWIAGINLDQIVIDERKSIEIHHRWLLDQHGRHHSTNELEASSAGHRLCGSSCNGSAVDEPVMITYRLVTMEILTALAILPFLAALVVGAREAEDEQA